MDGYLQHTNPCRGEAPEAKSLDRSGRRTHRPFSREACSYASCGPAVLGWLLERWYDKCLPEAVLVNATSLLSSHKRNSSCVSPSCRMASPALMRSFLRLRAVLVWTRTRSRRDSSSRSKDRNLRKRRMSCNRRGGRQARLSWSWRL